MKRVLLLSGLIYEGANPSIRNRAVCSWRPVWYGTLAQLAHTVWRAKLAGTARQLKGVYQYKGVAKSILGSLHTAMPMAPPFHCVLKYGFTWTSPRNQDVTVKAKSELIFIKFQYFFNVLFYPKPICFTQMILSMCEPQKELKFDASFTSFWQFQIFPGIPLTQGQKGT